MKKYSYFLLSERFIDGLHNPSKYVPEDRRYVEVYGITPTNSDEEKKTFKSELKNLISKFQGFRMGVSLDTDSLYVWDPDCLHNIVKHFLPKLKIQFKLTFCTNWTAAGPTGTLFLSEEQPPFSEVVRDELQRLILFYCSPVITDKNIKWEQQ